MELEIFVNEYLTEKTGPIVDNHTGRNDKQTY